MSETKDTGTAFGEIHEALDCLKAHLDTGRRAQRERDELRRQLPQYDCCYTGGPVADVSGKHCPPESPCLTCQCERLEAALGTVTEDRDAYQQARRSAHERIAVLEAEVDRLTWEASGSPMPGETPLNE